MPVIFQVDDGRCGSYRNDIDNAATHRVDRCLLMESGI